MMPDPADDKSHQPGDKQATSDRRATSARKPQLGPATLNDKDLASLLDEIVYAVQSEIPIEEVMQRLGRDRMGRLGKAAKRIAEHLETGGSLPDAILTIKSRSAQIAASAATPNDSTGHSIGLGKINADLLALLASRIRARYDAARVSRLTWFYPLVLLAIAYAAVLFVVVPLVNEYRFHQTEQPLGIHWPAWLSESVEWLSVFPWFAPVLFFALLVVGYFVLRLRPTFGTSVRKSLFCHALADQLTQGVPESDAIFLASSLSSYSIEGPNPSLTAPQIKQLLSKVGGISEATGTAHDQSLDKESINEESERLRIASSAAQLRYLGNLYQFAARRHLRTWSIVIPQIATVVFGLIFMTGYVWFVLGPIYREVARW